MKDLNVKPKTETCRSCGKTVEAIYATDWARGFCHSCDMKDLKNYKGSLGDTTGDRSNGCGDYEGYNPRLGF
jgi:hypothetical protein